ncbi:MAG: aminopeptidase P N-terminal domain-containing protein, partial [Pseudomonadota bacterium]|nr:aminopeptidase P N-terminal domain-containing protein [Pseudomonadota bacterium]
MIKLDSAEYAKRRKALMEKMSPNSIAILASAPVTVRNRDVEHPFRQDSDFY